MPVASYDLSGRRILVVDGDEAFGAWAEGVLRGAKAADVRRARSGQDASAAIADFAADLVLLELPPYLETIKAASEVWPPRVRITNTASPTTTKLS